jgi:hypothetical protein
MRRDLQMMELFCQSERQELGSTQAPQLEAVSWQEWILRMFPKKDTRQFQHAGAYLISSQIIVHSDVIYQSGWSQISEPIYSTSLSENPALIGEYIRQALDACTSGVPDPQKYVSSLSLVLKAAKLRSNRELQQNSVLCFIEEGEGGIKFVPTHNGGTRGDTKGFQFLNNRAICVPSDSDPSDLGAALLRAFKECTSIYSNT